MKVKEKKQLLNNDNPYNHIKKIIKKDSYVKKDALIEVIDLKHTFKSRRKSLTLYDGINLEIYKNEHIAILGPNGAGKTFLVSLICGISKFDSGQIKYNFRYNHTPFEKLSVQFQDLQFPNALTPKDLIEFSQKIADSQISNADYQKGLEVFQIDSIINTKMSKLSGGQQQRINVFISMLTKPKVLFLDEFTTGLDIAIKNNIQDFIEYYCKKYNVSLVIISHDIDIIEDMASRIIVLANKQIIVDAKTKELIKEFGDLKKFLRKYIIY